MASTAALVQGLIRAFVKHAEAIGAHRIALGDAVLGLWEHLSKSETVDTLRESIPDERARMLFGRVISSQLLNDLATVAETFRKDKGLAHGEHLVTREDIEQLDLKPAELSKVALAVQGGTVRVKDLAAAAKGGKKGEKALAAIKQGLTDKPDLSPGEQLTAKRDALAKLTKRIAKLQAERKALMEEIAALEAASAAPVESEQPRTVTRKHERPAQVSVTA